MHQSRLLLVLPVFALSLMFNSSCGNDRNSGLTVYSESIQPRINEQITEMTHVTSDGVVEVEAEMDTEVEAAVEAGRTETSAFSGKPLVIEQGMVVTWVNNDSVSHTISSDLRGSLFAAVVIAPGESFSYQFDRPGTYHYYGEAQDRMKGTVVVSESGLSEEQPPEEEQPPQEQPPQEQPPQEQPPQQQKPQDQQQQQQPIPSPSPTASPSPSPDPSQSPSPSPSPDQE